MLTFNQMVNNRVSTVNDLDLVFGALSDGHRRAILSRLAQGPLTVSQIAKDLPISLPATSKHLRYLENAGLLTRTAEGRLRHCAINLPAFESAATWIQHQRAVWDARFDALERFLEVTAKEEE
jgi:DNA-binding transcriptional ArsR family regulator